MSCHSKALIVTHAAIYTLMLKHFYACLVEHNVLHHHQKCLHAQPLIINSNIKASGAILDYDKTHTQFTTQTGCHGNAGDIIMTPLPADIELRCVVSPPREHPWILYHPLYKTETYIYTHTHKRSLFLSKLIHIGYACQLQLSSKQAFVVNFWVFSKNSPWFVVVMALLGREPSLKRQLQLSVVRQTDDPKHPGMMGGILILTWESSLQRAACVLTALMESANELQQWVTGIGLAALMELKIASETPAGLERSPRWYLIYLMFPCLPSPLESLKRYTLINHPAKLSAKKPQVNPLTPPNSTGSRQFRD